MLRPLRLAVTTGDANGIGPEVTSKALLKLGPQKNSNFYLWRNSSFPEKDLRRIRKKFKIIKCSSWEEALSKTPSSHKELIDICGKSNPAIWVEEAAQACFFKHLDALTTAPLSKPSILESGLTDLGHTDILKRVSQTKNAYMVFYGNKFNVFLATGHLPLSKVSENLTAGYLETVLSNARDFYFQSLGTGLIAVLGLNPHAGDSGLIGSEEKIFFRDVINKMNAEKTLFEGPLVPDAAFTPENIKKYSLFVAMYHDQGLIPFKTVHGHNGVHLTWGLPFIRTSVDHGTAFDIAGKNKADETSMYLALKMALKLSRKQNESRNI